MTAIAVAPASEATVITIDGELIVGNRQRFKQMVLDYIAAGRRRFVLDLTGCGYIDTSGLGVLVSVSKKIRDAEGRFVLCGMNDDLTTLLQLSKLDTLFRVADTRELALRAVNA